MDNEFAKYLEMADLPTSPESNGYQRLADFMAWMPSAAIFSRFASANMFNLLGLQAEVAELQDELASIIRRQNQDQNPGQRDHATDWSKMQSANAGNSERRLKVLELRAKLAEYNTALIQQITMHKQPNPPRAYLKYLQSWITHPEGGNMELQGPGSDIWFTRNGGDFNLEDKLALSTEVNSQDSFTRVMRRGLAKMSSIMPFLTIQYRTFPPRNTGQKQDQFAIYSSSDAIVSGGDRLATILASLLTTIPIVILNFVPSTNWRLGLVVLFTVIFSSALTFTTTARRAEVFGASAAFAAVQVVFVGSANSGNGGAN